MTFFSTILNSNNAGRRSQLKEWLKDHRFFIGVDRCDVKITIHEDLSITLDAGLDIMTFIGGDFVYPEITITELPPYGIRKMENFRKITFINISEEKSDRFPQKYSCVPVIDFEYCKVPQSYVDRLRAEIKRNLFNEDIYKVITNHCDLV